MTTFDVRGWLIEAAFITAFVAAIMLAVILYPITKPIQLIWAR